MHTTLIKQVQLATILLLGSFVGFSGNAVANEPASQQLGVEAMFAALGEGRFDVAEAIANDLDAKAADKSLFLTFVRATQSVANDDCASGAPLAQSIVSRSPLFLPAYDLIAKCLVEAGEPAKAAAMFDDVASRLNKGAERDQIVARAQSLRPDLSPKFSVDGNLQPSTNANRGTSATDINGWQIADASRTKAGVMASAFGTVVKPVYVSKRLISSVSLRAGTYFDTVSEHFFPTARLSLNTRYLLSPQTSIGAVLSYEHTLKGGAFESASPGFALDISHQVSPALSLGARTEVAYTHHNNDLQTGWTTKLDANASYTILPDDRLSVAASFVREHRKADTQSFNQIAISTEWEHAFANGFIGSLGGEASYRVYQSNAPLTLDKQVNVQAKAIIGVSHRDFMIGKFRPEVAYTFTKQWSNDVFSDFTAHDVSVRVKAGF